MLIVNFILCTALGYIGLCRLKLMDKEVKFSVRVSYTGLVVAATASGLQFWLWGTYPDWDAICFAVALLFFMGASVRRWSHGVPQEFRTDWQAP